MRRFALLAATLLAAALLAGCVNPEPEPPAPPAPVQPDGRDDVVVVAVIDVGLNPYHFDFRADLMPQHTNDDPTDDLPLGESPAAWIPGFPDPSTFASYGAMDLTLPDDPKQSPAALADQDKEAWGDLRDSSPDGIHLRYIPGTKVIGVVDFNGGSTFAASSHGVGTTSVSTGNIHGTCPSCVLLFVDGFSDEAVSWVAQQDWIDVQTNSWGFSKVATDKVWTDCDLETQRLGVERGQQIFFSGGNGLANAFDAPVVTLASCQKGPDWIVAVGANTPEGDSYTGHGKPADIANVGSSYPSAGGATLEAEGSFGGTSNATPVTAGLYAQALHDLRRQMAGASRVQRDGVIAQGDAGGCGSADAECPIADGQITVHELRQALFDAARMTPEHMAFVSPTLAIPAGTAETELLNEGHGSFFGHLGDPAAEVALIVAHARGDQVTPETPEEAAWHAAVSYCSQMVWGSWAHGAWKEGEAPPGADPQWPLRTWFVEACPATMSAAMAAADLVP